MVALSPLPKRGEGWVRGRYKLFSLYLNIKKRNNAEEHCFIPLTQTLSPPGARA